MHKIVVGVDGSAASDEALRWAMDEARRWDATVIAIHAWDVPVAVYAEPGMRLEEADFEVAARGVLTDALARTIAEPAFRLDERTVHGRPEDVLIEAADEADVIVAGASHHGALERLLLGSVASAVTHRARCPVVLVPERADAAA